MDLQITFMKVLRYQSTCLENLIFILTFLDCPHYVSFLVQNKIPLAL